jgi:hypothetical protein
VRPHVELIHEGDYVWHAAELVGGSGRASERRLSVDEEDGSSSLRVDFHTDWTRDAGVHHADTEFYVLDGEISIGDVTMGKGGYIHAPKGVPTAPIRIREGSKVLHYREYGDAGFDAGAQRWADALGDETLTDTQAMKYDPELTVGPMPGLFIKYLYRHPVTGFYTRLVYAKEGWSDHRLAHHPCYEEAYTVGGRMTYSYGYLDTGTYFFRPALVKHGHFVAEEGGCEWLLRSDGELTNWYTSNEWISWGGDAENYGKTGPWSYDSRKPEESPHAADLAKGASTPTHEHHDPTVSHAAAHVHGDKDHASHPIPSTLPVRSRSRRAWKDWDGM